MRIQQHISIVAYVIFVFAGCASSGQKTEKQKTVTETETRVILEENEMSSSDTEETAENDGDLQERLTPMQYQVTQQCGTERAFTGKYWDTKTEGVYHCVVCDAPLFTSETKYDSGSGWPSFWEPVSEDSIRYKEDKSLMLGMRIEAQCAKCGAHLGHVFADGPQPSGQRYCINSASLDLEENAE